MTDFNSEICPHTHTSVGEGEKSMTTLNIALVKGDGAAPEMMEVACAVTKEAARKDGFELNFSETPMGWAAYEMYGDTLPEESLRRATDMGYLFFGGVGDPEYDNGIGVQHPELKPEARALLTIRKEWELLLNFRPMIFYPELRDFTNLAPRNLRHGELLEWHFVRYLLEDSYFGTRDLYDQIVDPGKIGLRRKGEVTGSEDQVAELSYYSRRRLEEYFRGAFRYAEKLGLPVVLIDKANVSARYQFWRMVCQKIHKEEFSHVELKGPYFVDAANAMMFQSPWLLHGVMVCGNEHGDILSDGGAAALGSMGMMCSSAINPGNGMGMFESG
ncbi:MAG: isocitrate/isopropylmalate family dehydrogenase, partial [Candidatus Peregrinibacteria bacterium]|nr:isocitrate/isopropylmalate family dehydrogenase [Candidatus Peregrinibacteria bacterium]